ncbi:MAG: hypothetical protein KA968_11880 [Chitinophagaceae bacterium]|nr:hypothetical protein [Chitinophagaceae bacterium]
MKAVFITYNQSIADEVQEVLYNCSIRGFTKWTEIMGKGTNNGNPHEGTHTWPELNNAHLTIINDDQVLPLMIKLKELNDQVEEQGLRAFVWNIESSI